MVKKAAKGKCVRKSKMVMLSPAYRSTVEVVRDNWVGLRQSRCLSQSKLGELIGITQQRVNALESKQPKIPLHWIIDAFSAMGAPVHLAFVPGSFKPRETRRSARRVR